MVEQAVAEEQKQDPPKLEGAPSSSSKL